MNNGYPNFNNQFYMQQYEKDLQNIVRDAQGKINQLHNQQQMQPPQQQVPITQNFQLAPNQNMTGIKYVNDIEDVKKELVFADTLFVNKEYTKLWAKNASGEVKAYEIKEIIEKDEKDLKIDELMAKINQLESEMKNNESSSNVNSNVNATTASKKSSGVSKNKSSDE